MPNYENHWKDNFLGAGVPGGHQLAEIKVFASVNRWMAILIHFKGRS